ncbi:hypothetical protein M9458_029969, partial [Cirrhinus mrigala]
FPEETTALKTHKPTCDEWGGAESRGNGTRPVEYNDNERHLRHSPVSSPTEELRKDKRRSDDSKPGLDFILRFV